MASGACRRRRSPEAAQPANEPLVPPHTRSLLRTADPKALQALDDGVGEGDVRHGVRLLQPHVLQRLLGGGPLVGVALQAGLHKLARLDCGGGGRALSQAGGHARTRSGVVLSLLCKPAISLPTRQAAPLPLAHPRWCPRAATQSPGRRTTRRGRHRGCCTSARQGDPQAGGVTNCQAARRSAAPRPARRPLQPPPDSRACSCTPRSRPRPPPPQTAAAP